MTAPTRDRMMPRAGVALAPYCTMGVGGPAEAFVEATDEAGVHAALDWARRRGMSLHVLGGGSNVVIADEGLDGLVLKIDLRHVSVRVTGTEAEVTAAAGEPWDDLVGRTVAQGLAGLECLSGIPGLVGATPIQNVGAYGQDVSETIIGVRAMDRLRGEIVNLSASDCGFAYRDSALKSGTPDRYIVLAVTYRLRPGGAPTVRYADVVSDLDRKGARAPTLADVRRSVLHIRRSKSMVLDAHDPNRRSCGSFFVNPIVTAEELRAMERRATGGASMPRWPEPDGRVKLSAAWLIEHAGFTRGHTEGPVGLSSRHALAIVCHDGASARDVVGFARRLRARVEDCFGVRLTPEPVFWGPVSLA